MSQNTIARSANQWENVREMAARPKFVTVVLIRENVIRATLSLVIFVTDRHMLHLQKDALQKLPGEWRSNLVRSVPVERRGVMCNWLYQFMYGALSLSMLLQTGCSSTAN